MLLLHLPPPLISCNSHTPHKKSSFFLYFLRKRCDKCCIATPSTVSCNHRVGSSWPTLIEYVQGCLFFLVLFLGCLGLLGEPCKSQFEEHARSHAVFFNTFNQPTRNEFWRLLGWGIGIKLHWPIEASLSMYGMGHSRFMCAQDINTHACTFTFV